MSADARPEPIRFDPGSGEIPPELATVLDTPDRPILLLVAPDAGDASVRVALAIAEARGGAGRATILADGAVAEPRLHEFLDVDNLEGLADLFLFGASLPRVLSRPETWSFDFVPAGAYVPDPAGVLESPRWVSIASDLKEAGSQLILFVPSTTPGLAVLSRRVGHAVLVGGARDMDRMTPKLDPSCRVEAAIEPAAPLSPERLVAMAGSAPLPGAATIFDDPRLTEPPVFRSDRRPKRRAPGMLLVLLLLVAVGAAGWFLYQEYLATPAGGTVAGATTVPEPQPPARGEPVETPIPVSVAVEAHQDLASASQRLTALRRAEPGMDFYLAPVAVSGVLYYRLLAGPASDRESGTALLQRLVDGNHKTSFDSWAVRPTELAFLIDEYDTRPEAVARVESLLADEVPAYVVAIRYEPGPPRFRVYGGAYETAVEAEVMKQMLENAGVQARLVQRTGEPVR